MFPGTVTDRGDKLESESALEKPEIGICSSFELVVLYSGFGSKRLGPGFTLAVLGSVGWNEMAAGPWLVLLTPVDSIWLFSVIPGLKLENGLGKRLGLVPWVVLELSLLPLLTVDLEMWLEPGVVRWDVGLRL